MFKISIEDLFERELYVHIIFWSLYVTYPLLQFVGNEFISVQWWSGNSNLPLILVFTYVCYLFIFPAVTKFKGLVLVVFTVVMTIFGVLLSKYVLDLQIYQLDNYSYWRHGLGILGEYAFVGLLFFSFYSIKKSFHLHNERRNAELNSLRAQINPHFLFNTLNSIYSYSLRGDNKANELILKLAANFKYILHEGQQDTVTVESDLNHIKDYISIHQIRWGNKIQFNVYEELSNKKLPIASLILISFVENAVKYTSKLEGEKHKINIDYRVDDTILSFKCSNPYNGAYELSPEWKKSGIGLNNTKKRLDLIYKHKYKLDITDENSYFTIDLNIELC